MKIVKKWLFPVLTCLIVIGAAALPPYISQARDDRQFGQIYAEELAADTLPVRAEPTLSERLALYARWRTKSGTIVPSFQSPELDEEQAKKVLWEALSRLAAGVIPYEVVEADKENTNMDYILLWDPTASMSGQDPVIFWRVQTSLGEGSAWMDIDAESGLPISLSIFDPNMAKWLDYKDPNTLPDLAWCFFELLGVEAEQTDANEPNTGTSWELLFYVPEIEMGYRVAFNATTLDIGLYDYDSGTTSSYVAFDG